MLTFGMNTFCSLRTQIHLSIFKTNTLVNKRHIFFNLRRWMGPGCVANIDGQAKVGQGKTKVPWHGMPERWLPVQDKYCFLQYHRHHVINDHQTEASLFRWDSTVSDWVSGSVSDSFRFVCNELVMKNYIEVTQNSAKWRRIGGSGQDWSRDSDLLAPTCRFNDKIMETTFLTLPAMTRWLNSDKIIWPSFL